MTESKTENTAKRGRLAWLVARQLLPPGPTRALPDWPDAFTPMELAALQYPRPQLPGIPDTAKRERRGLIDALGASIEAGELVAGTEQRSLPQRPGRRTCTNAYLHGAAVCITPPPPSPVQVAVPTLTRPAFVAWLRAEPAAPALSVHVLAWLGGERQAAPEPESDAGKAGQAQAEIRSILIDMRTRDPELSLDEDGRLILPGQYAGFHGLCIGISRSKNGGKDPLFRVTTEHFKKVYCKGLCTVLQKGPPRPDDSDYYRKLAGEMGVTWTQPQEPKPRAKPESK